VRKIIEYSLAQNAPRQPQKKLFLVSIKQGVQNWVAAGRESPQGASNPHGVLKGARRFYDRSCEPNRRKRRLMGQN
jgi:hypothetical protein